MNENRNTKQILSEKHYKLFKDACFADEDDQSSLVQPTPMKIVDSRTTDRTSLYDEPRIEATA